MTSRPYQSLREAQRTMRRMVREDADSEIVEAWAVKATGAPPGALTPRQAARRIGKHLRETIDYVLDPRGNELLQDALTTRKLGYGDCDDMTVAVLTLARALGYEGRIHSLALDERIPDTYTHVNAQIRSRGGVWHTVDPTISPETLPLDPIKTRNLKI